jgi:hypothetical protein
MSVISRTPVIAAPGFYLGAGHGKSLNRDGTPLAWVRIIAYSLVETETTAPRVEITGCLDGRV